MHFLDVKVEIVENRYFYPAFATNIAIHWFLLRTKKWFVISANRFVWAWTDGTYGKTEFEMFVQNSSDALLLTFCIVDIDQQLVTFNAKAYQTTHGQLEFRVKILFESQTNLLSKFNSIGLALQIHFGPDYVINFFVLTQRKRGEMSKYWSWVSTSTGTIKYYLLFFRIEFGYQLWNIVHSFDRQCLEVFGMHGLLVDRKWWTESKHFAAHFAPVFASRTRVYLNVFLKKWKIVIESHSIHIGCPFTMSFVFVVYPRPQ